MSKQSPLYHCYPKDPIENLEWRIKLRKLALKDPAFRKVLYDACMSDVLFWMAFACWSFEPRARVKVRPFIPWPHQEDVFFRMDAAIDTAEVEEKTLDVLVDKARAQGGTFGYLWVDLRRWLRDRMFSAGYVTRNEDLVDSKTDSNTVLWKVAWALERLPFWMVPKGYNEKQHRSLSQHTFQNPENGSVLAGYAAGQDVAAGGRMTVFTCDEIGTKEFIAGGKDASVMESLHDVTNCLRLVSARYVDYGVFHEACEDPDSAKNGIHLILDWKDNPQHGKHSYRVIDGKPKALDIEDQYSVDSYHQANPDLRRRLERKGFKFDDVIRSPWYDMRCLRPTSTPRLIASQLDRNPRGAVGKVFPSDLLDAMKRTVCKPAIWTGNPVFDGDTGNLKGLLARDDGALRLWFKPGTNMVAPAGQYIVGCDVAIGSDGAYSSNSVASILDANTGEQVGEYVRKGLPMLEFADHVVGISSWFHKAELGWEDAGMIGVFAKQVVEIHNYPNVYYRESRDVGVRKKTRKPGWWNGKDEHKAQLFEKLALGMQTGSYRPRSEDLIRECGEYEWEKGKILHRPTKSIDENEKAHGDRCIAAGVAWLLFGEMHEIQDIDTDDESGQTPEYDSFLWRELNEHRSSTPSGSVEYSISDLLAK